MGLRFFTLLILLALAKTSRSLLTCMSIETDEDGSIDLATVRRFRGFENPAPEKTHTVINNNFKLDVVHIIRDRAKPDKQNAIIRYKRAQGADYTQGRYSLEGIRIIFQNDALEQCESLLRNMLGRSVNTTTLVDGAIVALKTRIAIRHVDMRQWNNECITIVPYPEMVIIQNIPLDNMYIEPRATKNKNALRSLSTETLLDNNESMIIYGSGGSGKSTWARWIFMKLLAHPSVFPIMIEAKALASWRNEQSINNSMPLIAKFIEDELNKYRTKINTHELLSAIADSKHLRLIVIIDGWDEAGEEGARLIALLNEFRSAYLRAQLVVLSRPFGRGLAGADKDYRVLYIEPFSCEDIEIFSSRFFNEIYKENMITANDAHKKFMNFIDNKNHMHIKEIARNPFMLTLMLILNYTEELCNAKYKIYGSCIKAALAYSDYKKRQGSAAVRGSFCPDDPVLRLEITKALAFNCFLTGNHLWTWQELLLAFPKAQKWTDEQKEGFLIWLWDRVGLLKKSESRYEFWHRSLQEYLAAEHLLQSSRSIRTFVLNYAEELNWWEVLQMVVALLEEQGAEGKRRSHEIIRTLIEAGGGKYWLAGVLLADGYGNDTQAADWSRLLGQRFVPIDWPWAQQVALGWSRSLSGERRRQLETGIYRASKNAYWCRSMRIAHWSKDAGFTSTHLPTSAAARKTLDLLCFQRLESEQQIAFSRVLAGTGPWWPEVLIELILLRAWPSRRKEAGCRLQNLASLEVSRDGLRRVAAMVCQPPSKLELELMAGQVDYFDDADKLLYNVVYKSYLARLFGTELVSIFGEKFAHAISKNFTIYFREYFNKRFRKDYSRYFLDESRSLNNEFATQFARGFIDNFISIVGTEILDVIRSSNITEDWFADYILFEMINLGRDGVRIALANFRLVCDAPEAQLIIAACRLSAGDQQARLELKRLLAGWDRGSQALWPALARYIAQEATVEDRDFLTCLLKDPGQLPVPLSWGIRYYIRGDVMQTNGTVVTLDELCDDNGLERLPLLDECKRTNAP